MATINGREYESGDITLILGGRDVIGLRGIAYKEKQEKSLLYGKGNRPIGIQKGNVSYEGTVTLLQSEVDTLKELGRTANGRASILGLSLNAVVCYGNPLKGDIMLVDRLFGIQFTEEPKEYKQGDANAEIALPFICTDIKYHG